MEEELIDQCVKIDCKEHKDELLKQNSILTYNNSNPNQVGNVGGGLENKETPYVNNEDSIMEVTTNDVPN